MKIQKNRKIQKMLHFAAKSLLIIALAVVAFHSDSLASGKGSKFGGVQIGTITYSYRSMPDQSLNAVLNYAVQSGVSSVELMGDVAERYAGILRGRKMRR